MASKESTLVDANLIGIGRPISPKWMGWFGSVFAETVGDSSSFMRRVMPGPAYVRGSDLLAHNLVDDAGDGKVRLDEVVNIAQSLVSLLCRKDRIDTATAQSLLELQARSPERIVRVDKNGPSYGIVKVTLADVSAKPGTGFVMTNEKQRFKETLGVEPVSDQPDEQAAVSNRHAGRAPLFAVGIGLVNNFVPKEKLDQLSEIVGSERVRLGPIGVVLLDTIQRPTQPGITLGNSSVR